ncbi:MAG: flagellar export chaperone FliS [Spartobacteria bacterium]|nr:flagellar export chaperone FliS [Spartobacteria bacterium]
MKTNNPLNIYRKTATTTASPGELVLMLFDGALRFMTAAEIGFQEENFARRNEQIHNNILRAQAIITELQATLNMEVGGEFSENLYRLYDFMQNQLSQANREKNIEKIKVVVGFVQDIREAWAQMLLQTATEQATVSVESGLGAKC